MIYLGALAIISCIGVLFIVAIVFINTSPQFGDSPNELENEKIRSSSNYKKGKFKNSEPTVVMKHFKFGSLFDFFNVPEGTPKSPLPMEKIDSDSFNNHPDTTTQVTWFGHSAILLQLDGKKIFLDPMLGDVPAPHPWLGGNRFNDTLPLAIDDLPPLDAVIISHDHYDHLDYESIVKIKSRVTRFFVPLGVRAHLIHWGIDKNKITELDWWESTDYEDLKIVCTPSRHFSGRGLFDRNDTLWSSWVILGKKHSIFFSGDSGYHQGFKKIGDRYGPFDLTLMECGQYNEQWPEIHMIPEETVQAHIDLRGDLLMPIHWGAFKLALHSWHEPVKRLLRSAAPKKVRVTTPKIGEPVVLDECNPVSKWWTNP